MTPPKFETLDYVLDDGVAVVTLNRPGKLNAFNPAMMGEILALLDHTDADDEVKAVIFTGAGRAFCAGADLGQGQDTFNYAKPGEDAMAGRMVNGVRRDGGGLVSLRIYESLKPVIAAVNGAAVGVGVTMQLPMDFRLASTEARFGFVFTRRGITPEAASSWFLSRLVGLQQALEWCFTGRIFGAQEALDGGLVRSIHAPADLLPAAKALAREIIDNTAPVSVALTRQMIWRLAGASHPMAAHMVDSRAIQMRGVQDDVREGVSSFLEKRPAAYPDKVSKDLPDIWAGWETPSFQ